VRALEHVVAAQAEELADANAKLRQATERRELKSDLSSMPQFDGVIGRSDALRRVLRRVEQVAWTDACVLLTGETGTGKDLIARAIHDSSSRKNGPLVKVDCTALPPQLIETELFGHERGAFTGALNRRTGRFEAAEGGTIFLNEIGDLPFELQAKLLRFLQEREFERVGSNETLKVDVRVLAATNRDLTTAVARGSFRSDLYYRLSVFPICMPPLRERREDLLALVQHFVEKHQTKLGKRFRGHLTNDHRGPRGPRLARQYPGARARDRACRDRFARADPDGGRRAR
jgi:transcriptional regulator with GAF, ATPase, and Fis domain